MEIMYGWSDEFAQQLINQGHSVEYYEVHGEPMTYIVHPLGIGIRNDNDK